MANMVWPFARFAACVGSAVAGTTLGSVNIQIAAAAKIAPVAMTNMNVRSLDTLPPPAQ
jgi:hypothetical protein